MNNTKNIKDIVDELSKNPYMYAKKMDLDDLASVIQYASIQYHNTETNVISDEIYDILVNVMEERDTDNKVLSNVGAPITLDKVKLPYWMGSMDKIKPDTNVLDRWKKKYDEPYTLSDKLDGVSGLLHSKSGKTGLYTRGNGTYGRNISHLIKYLFPKIVNNLSKQDITIRGEIIISKDNIEKHFEHIKTNPRSLVNGFVNTKKKINFNTIKYVDFIAFELVQPRLPKSEQFKFMKNFGFNIVHNTNVREITNDSLSMILENRRKESPYEIDGIIVEQDKLHDVVKSGNPKYGFAFKTILSEHIIESKVVDIIWHPSKHGYLKPVVVIEPVIISKTTVKHVTGNNAKFIKINEIGPGAIVKVTLGGGIIPKIVKVVKKSEFIKYPNIPYTWNKSGVDLLVVDLDNNSDVQIKIITNFFKKLETKNLSKGLITRLVNNGYKTIRDIINMNIDNFMKIDGIKTRLATKLYNNIQKSIKSVSLEKLMSASNVFGVGYGEKKFAKILSKLPNILDIDISVDELTIIVENINGFKKTANQFSKNLSKFKEFLKNHDNITIGAINIPKKNDNKIFTNKTFVVTGFRNAQLKDFIINNGGTIATAVSKNTNFVIKKDETFNSTKITKAIKFGTKIYTLDEFVTDYHL